MNKSTQRALTIQRLRLSLRHLNLDVIPVDVYLERDKKKKPVKERVRYTPPREKGPVVVAYNAERMLDL